MNDPDDIPGSPAKNRAGRPRKVITNEHLTQIETLAGYGMTEAAIAHILGMSPVTFWRNKTQLRPVIVKALARGRAVAESVVGEALFNRAKGGDIQAIRWWEMTRAGRRTASDVTTGGEVLTNVRYVIQSAAGEVVEEEP